MQEFDFITQCLKPLCPAGALDDDTSVLFDASRMLVNTDTLVQGRHFLDRDPPDTVAKKLVRVNISDLASTGAVPRHMSLAMTLGPMADAAWLRDFAVGLGEDLAHWGLTLIGGDTTRSPGPTVLTATITGQMAAGATPMRRSNAKTGQHVFLGRALGLGDLGLADAMAGRNSPYAWLYRVPEPQLALGQALSRLPQALACADVSDGLGADLGHIARASGVRIDLVDDVPLEPGGDMNAGDDYCLVFTAPPALVSAIGGIYDIGRVLAGTPGVFYRGQDISQCGYEHR